MTRPPGPAESGHLDQLRSVILRTRLFAASFAPLGLIFAARSICCLRPAVVWLIVGTVCFINGWLITRGATRRTARPVTLTRIRDRGGDVGGYLATYLLPFVGPAPAGYEEVLPYLIFLGVVWIIYLRSDLALINPTLYLLGWRVVEAEHEGRDLLVVCRDLPREDQSVRVVRFLDVYVEKRQQPGTPDE